MIVAIPLIGLGIAVLVAAVFLGKKDWEVYGFLILLAGVGLLIEPSPA